MLNTGDGLKTLDAVVGRRRADGDHRARRRPGRRGVARRELSPCRPHPARSRGTPPWPSRPHPDHPAHLHRRQAEVAVEARDPRSRTARRPSTRSTRASPPASSTTRASCAGSSTSTSVTRTCASPTAWPPRRRTAPGLDHPGGGRRLTARPVAPRWSSPASVLGPSRRVVELASARSVVERVETASRVVSSRSRQRVECDRARRCVAQVAAGQVAVDDHDCSRLDARRRRPRWVEISARAAQVADPQVAVALHDECSRCVTRASVLYRLALSSSTGQARSASARAP